MRERVGEATVMGTWLIGIGLGLVVVCVLLYQKWAAYFIWGAYLRSEYLAVAKEKGLSRGYGRLVLKSALGPILQLTGLASSVLIVVGVALRFGVHSALVVLTVVLVGVMLRPIITLAKRTRLPAPNLDLSEPLKPDF